MSKATRSLTIGQNVRVTEPTAPTEFEVQAYLWNELCSAGLNVRGEVKTTFNGRAACRFDLAVFDRGELTAIVEVKKSPIKHKSHDGWRGTRQGQRYEQFGVPVCIVYGMDDALQLIKEARAGRFPPCE